MPLQRFARKLGIATSSLHRLEQGDQNATIKMIEKLCARLRCDIADIFAPESESR